MTNLATSSLLDCSALDFADVCKRDRTRPRPAPTTANCSSNIASRKR